MSSRLIPLAVTLIPVSAVGTVELVVIWTSAGLERPYASRLLGGMLLVQLIVAALIGALGATLLPRRSPATHLREAAAVGFGLSLGLALLFVLANGVPRWLPPRSVATGPAVAIVAVVAIGSALLRRRLLTVPAARGALAREPLLIAVVLVGAYGALRIVRIPPASLRGLALWTATAVAAGAVAAGLQWLARRWQPDRLSALWVLPTAAAVAALVTFFGGRSPLAPVPHGGSPSPDVLLIVIDTTRADFAPAADATATPALHRLAVEGRLHTRVFSTSCWTVPAHGSLFTGLSPSEHGATWESPDLAAELVTLAERFSRGGWRTAAFSANPWVTPEFGFHQGFETFVVGDPDRRPLFSWLAYFFPALLSGRDAPFLFEDKAGLALTSELLRFLGDADERPAFVFLNLMEPHLPYLPPRRFLRRSAGAEWTPRDLRGIDQDRLIDLLPDHQRDDDEVEGLRVLYAAEVAYADHLVGRLLQRLEESQRLDRTIVVVTSDHGENLGQHPPLDHQLGLYDTLLRIPLLIRYPRAMPPGTVDDGMHSLADLPAALLTLAGLPTQSGDGTAPLLPERDAVFFEYGRPEHILGLIRARLGLDPAPWDRVLQGIRTADAKWIHASDERHQAYDLSHDPGEQRNLVWAPGGVPPSMEPLAARLETSVLTRRLPPAREPGQSIPEDARERLRGLGYIQ
jgi:arylsulfatase A-like enzyme